MTIKVKSFDQLSTSELYELLKARFSVFVTEQKCFYLDHDDIDYYSLHIFIQEGMSVVAYARLFAEEEPDIWHVGRVLTIRRKEGLGRLLMERTMQEAWRRGARCLRMDAQVQAMGFYEKMGFSVCSDVFSEAGMPHVKMEKTLL